MIPVNDFKTGVTIKLNNSIFKVLEFQHVKPGKGTAFVRSKLKNLKTGSIIEHTFNSGIKVPKARLDSKVLKYSYASDDILVFMDMNTYELIEIAKNKIDKYKFLKEELEVKILEYQGEILEVIFPEKIEMKIIKTDPAVKGDTATNAVKDAITETDLLIKVPLFINENDVVLVSTNDGYYVSRV